MSQSKNDVIAEHVAKIAELELESKDQLLLIANKTEEMAQLKEDFAAEKEEGKKQCEKEKSHLSDTFALKSLEDETARLILIANQTEEMAQLREQRRPR